MQEALRTRQVNMDHLNNTFKQLSEDSTLGAAHIPTSLQHKVHDLNSDWVVVQQTASNLRPCSDESFSEQMTIG